MPVVHVAEVFLAGCSKNNELIKRLQQKEIALNKDRLNGKSTCTYTQLETNLFDHKQIHFIEINTTSSQAIKGSLVYYFDITTKLLDSEIEEAKQVVARFEKGSTFVVVQTKGIIHSKIERKRIDKLENQINASRIYSSKSQQDMTELKQQLIAKAAEVAPPTPVINNVPSPIDSVLKEQSNDDESSQSSTSSQNQPPSPNAITTNFENSNAPTHSSIDSLTLKNSSEIPGTMTTSKSHTDDALDSLITNFKNKYDTDWNKNSTGIHNMLRQMETIKQGADPSFDVKLEKITTMMQKIANERLHGLYGFRNFWSTSSFFGKGRSKDANELYEACSQGKVTAENLVAFVSEKKVTT